jgi:hypothetical protein
MNAEALAGTELYEFRNQKVIGLEIVCKEFCGR